MTALAAPAEQRPRPLDRLDPPTRILAALAVVVTVGVLARPASLAAAFALAAAGAALARVPARALLGRLAHVEGFVLVLVVFLPLTLPGPTALTIGPVALSTTGIERAVGLALRVNVAALTVLALLGGLEPVRFGLALARLGVPERLVRLFLLSVRWIDLLGAEATRLAEAMRARAFVPGASLHTLRTFGLLAGLVLVRALDRAARVDEAMRCRGHAGRFPAPEQAGPGRADAVFALAVALALALLLALDRWS